MKRFYCTRTPGSNRNNDFLKATINEAVAAAKQQVEGGEQTVYVVQVIRKIERSVPPVKVSVVR